MTEHGTPAARLVPIERRERPAILVRLEAEGRLRPAKNPGYLPQRLHPVIGAYPNPLTRALIEERESER
jgi:antitoxin (DNA-binding transcriptional repressor) of toxin-antitoxin stability system